jgi:hypothetical protein
MRIGSFKITLRANGGQALSSPERQSSADFRQKKLQNRAMNK